MSTTLDQIAETLARLDARQARIEAALGTVASLATRKQSRAAQAKKAGCHPSTLWRRERRARAQLAAGGVL